MGSQESRSVSPRPESHSELTGGTNATPAATRGQARRGALSSGRIMELVTDLMNRRFYGKLALHFEAGHVVCAKLEQSIKE